MEFYEELFGQIVAELNDMNSEVRFENLDEENPTGDIFAALMYGFNTGRSILKVEPQKIDEAVNKYRNKEINTDNFYHYMMLANTVIIFNGMHYSILEVGIEKLFDEEALSHMNEAEDYSDLETYSKELCDRWDWVKSLSLKELLEGVPPMVSDTFVLTNNFFKFFNYEIHKYLVDRIEKQPDVINFIVMEYLGGNKNVVLTYKEVLNYLMKAYDYYEEDGMKSDTIDAYLQVIEKGDDDGNVDLELLFNESVYYASKIKNNYAIYKLASFYDKGLMIRKNPLISIKLLENAYNSIDKSLQFDVDIAYLIYSLLGKLYIENNTKTDLGLELILKASAIYDNNLVNIKDERIIKSKKKNDEILGKFTEEQKEETIRYCYNNLLSLYNLEKRANIGEEFIIKYSNKEYLVVLEDKNFSLDKNIYDFSFSIYGLNVLVYADSIKIHWFNVPDQIYKCENLCRGFPNGSKLGMKKFKSNAELLSSMQFLLQANNDLYRLIDIEEIFLTFDDEKDSFMLKAIVNYEPMDIDLNGNLSRLYIAKVRSVVEATKGVYKSFEFKTFVENGELHLIVQDKRNKYHLILDGVSYGESKNK